MSTRRNQQGGVPARTDAPFAHLGEEVAQAGFAVHNSGHGDTGQAGAGQHQQQHDHAIGEQHLFAAQEFGSHGCQAAQPWNRIGKDEIGNKRVTANQGFGVHGCPPLGKSSPCTAAPTAGPHSRNGLSQGSACAGHCACWALVRHGRCGSNPIIALRRCRVQGCVPLFWAAAGAIGKSPEQLLWRYQSGCAAGMGTGN